MDPAILYATTADGIRIACYAEGAGPALLDIEMPYSHLLAERRLDAEQAGRWSQGGVYAIPGLGGTLVRYDPRGFGLSDRDVAEFPLDAMVSDVEAVLTSSASRASCCWGPTSRRR